MILRLITFLFIAMIYSSCNHVNKYECYEVTKSNNLPDDAKCIDWYFNNDSTINISRFKSVINMKIHFQSNFVLPSSFCNLQTIKNIELYELKKQYYSSVLKQISCLKELEHLYLDLDSLSSIPIEICDFKSMSYLDLGLKNRNINIPKEMSSLKNLKVINIYNSTCDTLRGNINKLLPNVKVNFILE